MYGDPVGIPTRFSQFVNVCANSVPTAAPETSGAASYQKVDVAN